MEKREHKYLEMAQKNNFVQQYSKKITHLSQQGYGKKKVQRRKIPHERIPKRTSIGGGRVKMSSMNKHKKRSYKRKNRIWYVMKVSEKHLLQCQSKI